MRFLPARFVPALLACCFLFALFTGSFVAAANKPAPPPDMRKLVKSVDAATNSIVIISMHRGVLHTYRLDGTTTIQIDGAAATFAKIKPGMEVADSTERDADDLDALSLLSSTHAPVAPDPNAAAGPAKTIETVLSDKSAVVILFTNSKMEHTYHIDDSTTLKINGIPGKFADIKPGMEVKDYMERDSDDLDSLTLIGY